MTAFDPACERCPRLVAFLTQMRAAHPLYHNAPVPAFGANDARLLIIGLAPGMHGANASSRPFTGDFAGILLYRTLHALGLASAPESRSVHDGLELLGCRITNAVKCLPPQNKATTAEVKNCNTYLTHELGEFPAPRVMLALGGIAHRAVLRALDLKQSQYRFGHGFAYELPSEGERGAARWLVDSYHCSRYNTQTGRLTEEMFRAAVASAKTLAFGEA